MGPLSRDEFAALIAGGEDSFTEFKDPRTSNEDVAKEMCAFSNAQGGRILIGVDDDGRILDADGWNEERIMNIARTSIDPAIIPSYQTLNYDDRRDVVIVGVEMGVEKPYAWLRGRESRRYLIRVGSTSREVTQEELVRLAQASGAIAADLRPVLGSSEDDLDPALLAARFENLRSVDYGALSPEEQRRVLTAADVLHETGAATIAGLLCYGENPQARLTFALVSCASYPGGIVEHELLDRQEADGRVEQQIETAVQFIRRNLRSPSKVEGVHREERARPSAETLRELVANAVGHRHYGIAGPTQLRVFADRIEVLNPGGPPNGVTPQAMRLGVSIRRNEFIFQHLARAGIVDALGRGVVLLYDEAARLGLREPEIVAAETTTQVTLFLE